MKKLKDMTPKEIIQGVNSGEIKSTSYKTNEEYLEAMHGKSDKEMNFPTAEDKIEINNIHLSGDGGNPAYWHLDVWGKSGNREYIESLKQQILSDHETVERLKELRDITEHLSIEDLIDRLDSILENNK